MRKFLALVLSVIMAVSAVSSAALAAKFTDVPASDETLTRAVELLSSVGITTGTTETTFGTSEKVTRQQMATFVYRLMKAGKSVEGGDNLSPFTDLVDPFYNFMITWANEMDIIKGTSQTTFNPTGQIILQDAYTMLVRALGYEEYEIFEYPFGYIEKAEEIGLDEGLPASVNYTTALTRGNVAVLLYNAFYANLAKGITTYESEVEPVMIPGTEDNPRYKLVEVGKIPVVTHSTVAESIFGIKRTVQRIVATPNYSLADPYTKKTYEKTDGELDDETLVSLACYDLDYKDTDAGLFGDVLFEDLGLEGEADDYFLIDLAIYYKEADNGDKEILSANALGTRKKNIPKSNAKFERSDTRYIGRAQNSPTDIYHVDSSQARFQAFTGKVTVDGVVSYLFNAPWSYLKPKNMEDKDDANITLLFLDSTDRDPESEDFVQDYNFVAHTDAVGRGYEQYSTIEAGYIYNKDKVLVETYVPKDIDERGGGLYTNIGIYNSMYTCITSNNYEVDVWDSNGDGKIDYMWTKPYTIARISNNAGDPFNEMHKGGDDPDNLDVENILDRFGPLAYEKDTIATIYTYGATVDNDITLEDGKLFTGYINGPANFICASKVENFKYEKVTFSKFTGDESSVYFGDQRYYTYHSARSYIGFPGRNGERDGDFSIKDFTMSTGAAFVGSYFGEKNVGKSYMVVIAGDLPFHVKPSGDVLGSGDDYAIIFPNTNGEYAYTTSVGVVTNGNLQKTGNYIDVMIGGEIKSVSVKPQLDKDVAENNTFKDTAGEDICLRPITPEEENEVFNFNAYVGKLLTYTINSKGEYVFAIAPLELNVDKSVLSSDNPDAYYTYQADNEGKTTSAFVKAGEDLYQFVNAGYGTLQQTVSPSKYVRIGENAKIVIKTVEEGEEVFTIYDIDNLPDFDDSVDLKKIKYVVKNNPKSTSIEELVYLYAEAMGDTSSGSFGNIFDYRFVKEKTTVRKGEETVVYYDVYNPFTGKIEEEYEAYSEDPTAQINGIYALTTSGYVANHKQLGNIDELGVIATSDVTDATTNLGLVKISGYDEENGLLEVEDEELLFQIDDDTVVTFLDLDKETIKKVDTSVLGSTSKTYRCNDNKDMPLLAFIVSSEIKKEDEYELAELIVIVRYNRLDDTDAQN